MLALNLLYPESINSASDRKPKFQKWIYLEKRTVIIMHRALENGNNMNLH